MKGIIKAISVTEVNEGTQVIFEYRIGIVSQDTTSTFALIDFNGEYLAKSIIKLKSLVIEYEEGGENCENKHLHYDPISLTYHSCGFHKKKLPLKYSQWQYIIDNNLLDKEVEFKIIKTLIEADPPELRDPMVGALKTVEYAELVTEEERMYTKDEVVKLLKKAISYADDARIQVDRVAIGLDREDEESKKYLSFIVDSSEWIEENLKKKL